MTSASPVPRARCRFGGTGWRAGPEPGAGTLPPARLCPRWQSSCSAIRVPAHRTCPVARGSREPHFPRDFGRHAKAALSEIMSSASASRFIRPRVMACHCRRPVQDRSGADRHARQWPRRRVCVLTIPGRDRRQPASRDPFAHVRTPGLDVALPPRPCSATTDPHPHRTAVRQPLLKRALVLAREHPDRHGDGRDTAIETVVPFRRAWLHFGMYSWRLLIGRPSRANAGDEASVGIPWRHRRSRPFRLRASNPPCPFGLLTPVGRVATQAAADEVRVILDISGIRSTTAPCPDDGRDPDGSMWRMQVLVFAQDAARARHLVDQWTTPVSSMRVDSGRRPTATLAHGDKT